MKDRRITYATIAVLALVAFIARGDTFSNLASVSAYGNIQLPNQVATKIPATPTGGRGSISIQNLGTTTIYCGSDPNVTANTGTAVFANGQISIPVGFNSLSGLVAIYCYAPSAQTSPADTRWWETS